MYKIKNDSSSFNLYLSYEEKKMISEMKRIRKKWKKRKEDRGKKKNIESMHGYNRHHTNCRKVMVPKPGQRIL